MSEILYCRTCFSTKNLFPIFADEKTSKDRSEELFLVTGVMIKLHDDLSQFICESCINIVNDCLKLRSQSQATEKLLKTKKINVKKDLKTTKRKKMKIPNKVENKKCTKKKLESIEEQKSLLSSNCKEITQDEMTSNIEHENTQKESRKAKTRRKDNDTSSFCNISNVKNENIKELDNKLNGSNIEHENSPDSDDSIPLNAKAKDENKNNDKERIKIKRTRLSKEQYQLYMSLAEQPVSKTGPVRCTLCRVELRERRFFINHAKTHFEAEHVCETCGRRFTSVSARRCHARVHSPRLACSLCPFRAVDKGSLETHVRVHTGERPFPCGACGRRFRARAAAAQHMRAHYAAYDVQCEKCPSLFRSRSELAAHKNKVHLMTYTYYCYLCPSTYKAAGTVKNHIVKIHGIPRDQHPPIKFTKTKRQS